MVKKQFHLKICVNECCRQLIENNKKKRELYEDDFDTILTKKFKSISIKKEDE